MRLKLSHLNEHKLNHNFKDCVNPLCFCGLQGFFFYQGFLSRTLTTQWTVGEGRGSYFIPLYHFHLLTNIQTFMCNFAREMTRYHISLTATPVFIRLLLNENYHLIKLLFDWLIIWCWFKFVCLLIWVKLLLQLFDMRETSGLSHIDYHPRSTSKTTNQVC